jgi:hypothetical protein
MVELKEERLTEELKEANISLILDTYDDIFSDFDSRPYSERALSDDFLLECKKAALEKNEGIELILSMPRDKRSINEEFKIKKRLREHFKKHAVKEEQNLRKIKREGLIWVMLGIIIMSSILYSFVNLENQFWLAVMTVFEVPSWFFIWEGMGKIFFESKKVEPNYEFYRKMSTAQITFRSY